MAPYGLGRRLQVGESVKRCHIAILITLLGACQSDPSPNPSVRSTAAGPTDGAPSQVPNGPPVPSKRQALGQLFAKAHHLDTVLGRRRAAVALYRQVTAAQGPDDRVKALAHLRLAELCRFRGDRRCAMAELDWLINRARKHPQLARRAEIAMVGMLHPQAGKWSALTRGPPVGFTTLEGVPGEVSFQFREAEKAVLKYVRVRLALRMHNVDAVLKRKRGALFVAIKAYEPLLQSKLPNGVAAALFRQGSLHQDYAEVLGRVRVPDEFLPRVAAKLRARLHGESVSHFKSAIERYRRAMLIGDVAAERWRRSAAQFEARLRGVTRRRPGAPR